jgi:hypothetical protein
MHLDMNVFGLWWGMLAGLGFILLAQMFFILRTNWENEVKTAMDRVAEDPQERLGLINNNSEPQ